MNGSAPNTSRVTSQIELVTNAITPVCERAGPPMRISSETINAATTSTPSPSTVRTATQARSGRLTRVEPVSGARPGPPACVTISLAVRKHGLSRALHRQREAKGHHDVDHGSGLFAPAGDSSVTRGKQSGACKSGGHESRLRRSSCPLHSGPRPRRGKLNDPWPFHLFHAQLDRADRHPVPDPGDP